MVEEQAADRRFHTLPLLSASLAVALGLLTFIGWISGLTLLASIRAKYIPMAPGTALCFSLIGLGLILHLERPSLRWIPRVFAGTFLNANLSLTTCA